MEEERDFVVFTDENGEEFELDVIDYFEYEGQEYGVLMDLSALECDDPACECEAEQDVYIMKIVVNGEDEEFLPADDDKMDILAEIVEKRLAEGCEDEDCDCEDGSCDCESHSCSCSCDHHHE